MRVPDTAWNRLARSRPAAAAALLVVTGLFTSATHAGDDPARPQEPSVTGRVLDDADKPVAGARVRLYRRAGRWERRHPMIEEVAAGADGSFRFKASLEPLPESQSRGLPPYVLVADHPGKALGWRTMPKVRTTFEGDIVLTAPAQRTITVVDAAGRPMPGAKVVVYSLGDRSSTSPHLQQVLELLRPDDGPLTSVTDSTGQATFNQLPRTAASFVATANGFADGYAFGDQNTVRLTPSAALSGTVSGTDGKPLVGIKVVLFATFMWEFEHAVTDTHGRYQFRALKARGWDMSAWGPNARSGNGEYKLWVDDDRVAAPTQSVSLEPNANETLDIRAQRAGVIRVTVTENGTDKPVPGVRIWGFDQATGSSSRFNAYTDQAGRATFYSVPEKIWLGIASPPEGFYFESTSRNRPGGSEQFDFNGGEAEIRLVVPRIGGPLITVSGLSTRLDGSPAASANLTAAAGAVETSPSTYFPPMCRADGSGRFALEGVPAGRAIHLYAETEDRKLAGTATVIAPNKVDPTFRLTVVLRPTIWVELVVHDRQGQPMPSRKFHMSPHVGNDDFPSLRRDVQSDEDGQIRVEGIVPGLSYRVQEDVPPTNGPVAKRRGKPPRYDEVLVLVPKR
jgi:hypothetical protein